MSTLKSTTAACLQDFALLCGQLEQSDAFHNKFEDSQEESGRLKVWAGNLGALAGGHSGLDWRLRESSVMRTSIGMLLQELQTLLRTCSLTSECKENTGSDHSQARKL